MHINTSQDTGLEEVWEKILKKLGEEANEICSYTSSFYKTQDGLECSLRKTNGELIGICYREKNKRDGYRWTIEKYT